MFSAPTVVVSAAVESDSAAAPPLQALAAKRNAEPARTALIMFAECDLTFIFI
jgi:hypothetical protein